MARMSSAATPGAAWECRGSSTAAQAGVADSVQRASAAARSRSPSPSSRCSCTLAHHVVDLHVDEQGAGGAQARRDAVGLDGDAVAEVER